VAKAKSTKSSKASSKASSAKPAAKKTAEKPKASKADKAKKRQLKAAPVSVREQASNAAQNSGKPRKVQRARSAIWAPFRLFYAGLVWVLRPFRFLLRPFKTRPMRAIGQFLASVLLLRYIRNSWQELRQVTWPDARTTVRLTFAVILFAVFFGGFVAAVDYVLGIGVEKLILK
jgi:preprotein translocase SecE subunit